jgi:hypothetical protein
MSYLERYVHGEQLQVWDELLAAGSRVREEPLASQAWAVARETMRRVRHNVDLLHIRLPALGYTFGYGWVEEEDPTFAVGQAPVWAPPAPDVDEQIADLERQAGPLPLSLRAFYALVGAVNFVGAAPPDWDLDVRADPLYVYPLTAAFAEYAEWVEATLDGGPAAAEMGDPGPFRVPIAPDALHKYNISGGMWYHIPIPNAAIDAHLAAEPHATTFVNYLRIAFQWGGFPGLQFAPKCPEEVLRSLREGLLPM